VKTITLPSPFKAQVALSSTGHSARLPELLQLPRVILGEERIRFGNFEKLLRFRH